MQIVTFGGVTLGLCILIVTLVRWYPGYRTLRKKPMPFVGQLLPFLLAWAYGVLAILTVGGLIGRIADATLWISNWLGDVALVWGVGVDRGQSATGHTYLPLTQTGSALVLILTAAMVVGAKKSKYGSDLKSGAWCGICLGTSAGVAGFAAVPLATVINHIGDTLYGAVA
ncbi:hypothetical protein [Streptomyces drozdowiczii]|uniref:Uncharacterized protein n=1 Tax=Streptomyces drozdowiczii TaxID=202862 RepID=A0ABY6PPE1_9ACTN|nr:hypothetical protein [Streptomyces drozdowiczii]MCX0246429.1 hypothetical protein [Streptomyces drozdowiczii]UZK54068.1 hypothetical protein NEH16_07810 [Streptomyces drozdowiczii]